MWNYALFSHMSVGANLAFPLEVRGLGEQQRRERVARALELVRLDGLEGRPSQPALRWSAATRSHRPRLL